MIVVHQDNVTAFAGGHTWYWPLGPLFAQRISALVAAGAAVSPGNYYNYYYRHVVLGVV